MLHRAEALHCETTVDIVVPRDSFMNDFDLNIILSNLLDNALEAARKTQNGTMDLILCGGEGYLQIDLENASAKPLLLTDGRARTDKEDLKSHGRGLRIVRQIVEKYDGMMRVENREGSVTVRVVLFRKGKV